MATFTDNLDGTAGDLLSSRSGWSRPVGLNNVTISATGSGVCLPDGTSGGNSTWHEPTSQPSGNDQYAEAFLYFGAGGNPYQLGVRCDTTIGLGEGYFLRRDGTLRMRMYRRDSGGTFTLLGTYNASASTDYDTNKVRLEVTGTSLSAIFMGSTVIGPVTDTARSSGSVAMLSRGGTLGTAALTDDWGSGDLVAAGAIAGSTAPTFTAAGVLQATGALAGASSPAVTGAGVISATGALSGASSITSTAAGAVAASGRLTGASSPAFAASGAIAAAGLLSGSSDPAFTGSGTLYNASAPAGSIIGAATVTTSASGIIAGAGAMAGAATAAVTASGTVTGTGAMIGAAAVAVTGSAIGTATALLSGASSIAFAAAGAISGTASGLSGASSLNLSGAGILRGSGALMGTGSVTFTASAVVVGNDNGPRVPTVSRPVLTQGTSRPRQYSTARPRAASSW